jgi:hypothetical protein
MYRLLHEGERISKFLIDRERLFARGPEGQSGITRGGENRTCFDPSVIMPATGMISAVRELDTWLE